MCSMFRKTGDVDTAYVVVEGREVVLAGERREFSRSESLEGT